MAVVPATANPIPNPTIPCSQRGVLNTRSFPANARDNHLTIRDLNIMCAIAIKQCDICNNSLSSYCTKDGKQVL